MTRYGREELGAMAPVADRQMRRWELQLQNERLALERIAARLPQDVHPYVAISREAGADGGEIGRVVAQRLGCECFDNELLTYVLDKETGLVWERDPKSQSAQRYWYEAVDACLNASNGGRRGWRLPTVTELATLVAVDGPSPLPAGHPFEPIDIDLYWTANTSAFLDSGDQVYLWELTASLMTRRPNFADREMGPGGGAGVWCVRASGGFDGGKTP